MAQVPNAKPQMDQKHPDRWNRDLNPDQMAGQNIGGIAEAHERMTRTAHDVKPVHRALQNFSDDELKEIPILEAGTRLRQGATYLDLQATRVFTATGEMSASEDQLVVPKDGVHYDTWNKLVGERSQ